jgi:hypothetical protein
VNLAIFDGARKKKLGRLEGARGSGNREERGAGHCLIDWRSRTEGFGFPDWENMARDGKREWIDRGKSKFGIIRTEPGEMAERLKAAVC